MMLRLTTMVTGQGPMAVRYAPMSPSASTFSARKLPSASIASARSTVIALPWWSDRKLSERSAHHLTGRPSLRAAYIAQIASE